ncbi:MAG: amidohydrolase family protein [Aristaeellaceae bacterium]
MSIIDFHTHPLLNHSQSLCFYPDTVPDTPEGIREQLLQSGVTHICGSVLRADHHFDMRELNDAALALREVLGDFYTPGFHIHPGQLEASLAEIRRMDAAGVKLIGELVPYMHGWNDFDQHPWVEELNALLDEAQRCGMVFSYHTIWDWPLEPVIAAHPDMAFVAAHPGDRDSVPKHVERMRRYDNAYLDLSGTGIFRFGSIRYLVNQVGVDRILFGTDYPICNPEMYIHAVLGEHLGDRVEQKIFHDNAARLLGL